MLSSENLSGAQVTTCLAVNLIPDMVKGKSRFITPVCWCVECVLSVHNCVVWLKHRGSKQEVTHTLPLTYCLSSPSPHAGQQLSDAMLSGVNCPGCILTGSYSSIMERLCIYRPTSQSSNFKRFHSSYQSILSVSIVEHATIERYKK